MVYYMEGSVLQGRWIVFYGAGRWSDRSDGEKVYTLELLIGCVISKEI